MNPKFKCPFCGKERHYETSPKAVMAIGDIYFKDTDLHRDVDLCLELTHTFCTITCLLNYIDEWHLDALEAKCD